MNFTIYAPYILSLFAIGCFSFF